MFLTSALGVADDVAGADDATTKSSPPGFAHNVFTGPLALAVPSTKVIRRAFEVVRLRHTRPAALHDGIRELDVVIAIQNRRRRDESEALRLPRGAEEQCIDCASDVCGAELGVWIYPVDLSPGQKPNHQMSLGIIIPGLRYG